MDNLPAHITRTIDAAIKDHYLVSWRIYGEENVQVTLKFKSNDTVGYQYDSMDTQYAQARHYRSKPPCSVSRDQSRLVHFIHNKHDVSNQSYMASQDQTDIINAEINENVNSVHVADDSGIDPTSQHTVLMSSTPVGTLVSKHNATNAETMCIVNTQTASIQTDSPTAVEKSLQTDKRISRKTQTLNFNSQYERTQTLPICTSHSGCQADPINHVSSESMTSLVNKSDMSTNTSPLCAKHIQTHIVHTRDQLCGTSKEDVALQTKRTTKSRKVQVDTNLTTILPLQGVTGTSVWVESAVDHLVRNQAILNDMMVGLNDLGSICGDIT